MSEIENPAGDMVPIYAWGQWPDHLLTKKQMGDAGYTTGKQLPSPAGAVYRSKSPGGVMWLYDKRQGVPKRAMSKAQEAAIKKAAYMAKQVVVECSYCGDPIREMTRKQAEAWGPTLCFQCDDHNRAIRWARERLAAGCLILDTETTALSDGEIVQLAVIESTGESVINTLVMPRRPYRMFERGPNGVCAHDIHHLDLHAICQAPSWPTVWRWLAEVIQDREVLVYNLNFDFDVITRMNWAAGLPTPDHTHWDCLMHSYAAFHGAWSEYWGSYRWQPLQGGDHSAVGDCRAALDLLRHMANAEIRE